MPSASTRKIRTKRPYKYHGWAISTHKPKKSSSGYGQDEEDSNLALDDLRTATWSIARQHGMLKKFAHMDKPDVQHEPDPRTWSALGRIFCRAWFDRIWTVQEM